jgi:hypothetical protein
MTALTAKLELDASNLKSEAKAAAKAMTEVTDASDKTDAALDKVSKKKVKVEPTVEVRSAEQAVDRVDRLLKDFDGKEAKAALSVAASKASADITALTRQLFEVEGTEARANVVAKIADARSDLTEIRSRMTALDGDTARVNVEADTGKAKADLGSISDQLGQMPGQIGAISQGFAGMAAGPAGVVTAIAAVGAALNAAAGSFADTALEAQTYADLVGDSVEHASALLAVTKRVGIEANDLSDITVQMTQAFQQSPELAAELGINLADGRNGAERLVQVLGLMNSGLVNGNDKARIFGTLLGEEGVRQGQLLATQIGDIEKAVASVSDAQIIDPAEVERAKEYKAAMAEIAVLWQSFMATVGSFSAEGITDMIDDLRTVGDGLERIVAMVPGLESLGGIDWGAIFGSSPLDALASGIRDTDAAVNNLSGSMALVAQGTADVVPGMDSFGVSVADAARNLDLLDAAADSARQSTVGAGGAADATAKQMGGLTDKTDEATASYKGYADTLRASIDPAFAAIKAEQDLTSALEALNAEGGNTITNQIAVAEAGNTLASAQGELANSTTNATQTVYDMGRASGLTAQQAMELAGAVGDATAKAEDLEGNYQAILDADDQATPDIDRLNRALSDIDGRVVTVTTKQLTQFITTGTSPRGMPVKDSGGHIAAGSSAIVAERRPEFVNGALVSVPTVIYGPADVVGGAATQRLLAQSQASSPTATGRGSGGGVVYGVAGAPGAPMVQVLLDGATIGGITSRTVQLRSERERMMA